MSSNFLMQSLPRCSKSLNRLWLPLLAMVVSFPLAAVASAERELVERLVREQLTSWETEDEERFLATVHPDLVFAYPGRRMGVDGALEVFRFWRDHFSDTRIHIHALIIEGNRFSV
ncbi:MAG: SnoaL-like polyketide cyclase, partial [Verrucomicrobiota bacterium]